MLNKPQEPTAVELMLGAGVSFNQTEASVRLVTALLVPVPESSQGGPGEAGIAITLEDETTETQLSYIVFPGTECVSQSMLCCYNITSQIGY